MKESRRRPAPPAPPPSPWPPAEKWTGNLLASAAIYGSASPLCPAAPLSVYTLVAMVATGPRGAATKGPRGREVAPSFAAATTPRGQNTPLHPESFRVKCVNHHLEKAKGEKGAFTARIRYYRDSGGRAPFCLWLQHIAALMAQHAFDGRRTVRVR